MMAKKKVSQPLILEVILILVALSGVFFLLYLVGFSQDVRSQAKSIFPLLGKRTTPEISICPVDQYEPNNTLVEAYPQAALEAPRKFTYKATMDIGRPSYYPYDYYRLRLFESRRVYSTLVGKPGTARFDLSVRNSQGNVVAQGVVNGENSQQLLSETTLPAGTYFVEVYNASSSCGEYELHARSCIPRPACLDLPRPCKIPELEDYCPKVSIPQLQKAS